MTIVYKKLAKEFDEGEEQIQTYEVSKPRPPYKETVTMEQLDRDIAGLQVQIDALEFTKAELLKL